MRSALLLILLAASITVGDDDVGDSSEEEQPPLAPIPEGCKCLPIHECPNNALPSYGEGKIIFRVDMEVRNPCSSFMMRVCCPLRGSQTPTPTVETTALPVTTFTVTPERSEHPESSTSYIKNLPTKSGCGKRNRGGIQFRIEEDSNMVAQFAEFPWMVMVYNESAMGGEKMLVAGGSLIHERVVVTAAHRVINLNLVSAGVRAGEWDLGSANEPVEHQDMPISKIIIHEQFDNDYLFNNIALIVTTKPFKFNRNVGIVCLPKSNDVVNSQFCIANGWGRDLNGQYQQILKKIELPTVPRNDCETRVRNWSSEFSTFSLHSSVLCAGGIKNKDACEGDGGGPLTCPVDGDPSRSQLAGITSWGLECGTTYPAFYTNVANMRPWIDKEMTKLGFNLTYDY